MDRVCKLLLVLATILATLLGLPDHPQESEYYFKKALSWGYKSERYINLFREKPKPAKGGQIGDLVNKAETRKN